MDRSVYSPENPVEKAFDAYLIVAKSSGRGAEASLEIQYM